MEEILFPHICINANFHKHLLLYIFQHPTNGIKKSFYYSIQSHFKRQDLISRIFFIISFILPLFKFS